MALEEYVLRKNQNAINDMVEKSLDYTKAKLSGEIDSMKNKDDILAATAKLRDEKEKETQATERVRPSTTSRVLSVVDANVSSDGEEDEEAAVDEESSVKGKRTATGAAKRKTAGKASSTAGTVKGRGKNAATAAPAPVAVSRPKRNATKAVQRGRYVESDTSDLDDVEEDEEASVRGEDESAEEPSDGKEGWSDSDDGVESKKSTTAKSSSKRGAGVKAASTGGAAKRKAGAGRAKATTSSATNAGRGTSGETSAKSFRNKRRAAVLSDDDDDVQIGSDDDGMDEGANEVRGATSSSKGRLDSFVSKNVTPDSRMAAGSASSRAGSSKAKPATAAPSQVSSSSKDVIDLSGW